MKYIITAIGLFIVQSIAAQKIAENKVDEFTKNTVKRTSWEAIQRTSTLTAYCRVSKINDVVYLELRCMLGGYVFAIDKGDKLMLMTDTDSVITLLNGKYEISCKGCGSINITGSALQGAELSYLVSNDEFNFLLNNRVKKLRLYTTKGYVEAELKDKFSETLMKEFALIK